MKTADKTPTATQTDMMQISVRQITKDGLYDAVSPGDFAAMIDVDRYGSRSDAFDRIISASHQHFWDPLDDRYLDYSIPFDLENDAVMPEDMIPEFKLDCIQALTPAQKIVFINENARWMLSGILHGEQGALSLSASLCHLLRDPGAQEYAANQVREEARHVTAFARYIQVRWGKPLPVGDTLGNLLAEIVSAPEVYKKIVGMQLLVEGLAMGAFASFYAHSHDPLLKRLTQLAMTDEAFHHKFGKIWASRTIPELSGEEQNLIEDWALSCFRAILFNLTSPEQKKSVYGKVGLNWSRVQTEMLEAFTDADRRERMKSATNIFRVLIKTLVKAEIVTARTRDFYAAYVDMDELAREGDAMIGDDIAADGLRYLREINKSRKTGATSA